MILARHRGFYLRRTSKELNAVIVRSQLLGWR